MAVASTALSRGAGRVSRRLDRLSEHKFALLVSIPGLILVAPDRAPADAGRLRDEPVPDRAGQGRPDPVRRAQQLPGPVAAGRRGPGGDPANPVLRRDVDRHHPAARTGHRSRPQSRLPGRVDLLHGPADAVGGRVDRGRHLLARHLRHQLRDRERRRSSASASWTSRSTGWRARRRRSASRSSPNRGGPSRSSPSCCWPR